MYVETVDRGSLKSRPSCQTLLKILLISSLYRCLVIAAANNTVGINQSLVRYFILNQMVVGECVEKVVTSDHLVSMSFNPTIEISGQVRW